VFAIAGKNAFITGGSSGIGLAVAERFLKAGARVIVADVQPPPESLLESGATFIELDVADEQKVEAALQEAEDKLGMLDVLINNAGITGEGNVFMEDNTPELTQRTIDINMQGVYYGLKHGPKHMNDGGSIINTSSLGGIFGFPGLGPYSAAKAAVVSYTKTAALELAPRGIRVNAICPTFTRTAMFEADEVDYTEIAETFTPLGRVSETYDLDGFYHFLAAEESAFLTGQAIAVDGGMSIGTSLTAYEKLTG
jgi:NAD(P)-dependent dehydrogenase (short-subunit alcohol dehydrogenase family)